MDGALRSASHYSLKDTVAWFLWGWGEPANTETGQLCGELLGKDGVSLGQELMGVVLRPPKTPALS